MRSETPAQRLGRYVRARRKALKLTQADVQAADGPSTATLRLIEGGKHADFRDGTGADLEAALGWRPGSIASILAGGDPTAISEEAELFPSQIRHSQNAPKERERSLPRRSRPDRPMGNWHPPRNGRSMICRRPGVTTSRP